jgi:hypothetical protein
MTTLIRMHASHTEYASLGLLAMRTSAWATSLNEPHMRLASEHAVAANAALPHSTAGWFSLAGARSEWSL